MSLAAYFIDKYLKPRSVVLGFKRIKGRCTAVKLLAKIESTLGEFGLNLSHVVAFVSDGENKMKKLVEFMKEKSPGVSWIWCLAHRLQLCYQRVIDDAKHKDVENFIRRIHRVVQLLRRKRALAEDVSEALEKEGVNVLSLKYRNITRWTSTYDMLV